MRLLQNKYIPKITFFLITFMASSSCHQKSDTETSSFTEWRLGIVPDQNIQKLEKTYLPLVEYISHATGIKGRLIIPPTYSAIVDSFKIGKINIALFGGATFIKAHLESDAQPIALRNVDLRSSSIVLVNVKHYASTLKDLKGVSFGFGSRLSTSGHLMPRYFFNQLGIKPETFFSDVNYSKSHNETALKVQNGDITAGVINSEVIQKMFHSGELNVNKVKVIWQSPPFADYVWASQSTMSSKQIQAFRDALLNLSMKNPEHKKILTELGADYYVPASMDDFNELKEIILTQNLINGY